MASNSTDPRLKRLQTMLRKPADIQISSIEILESNVFAAQTIHFDRLTGIVGRHGSGKTLLLRLLDHVFGLAPFVLGQPGLDDLEDFGAAIEFVADVTVLQAGHPVSRRIDSASDNKVGWTGSHHYREWQSDLRTEFAPHFMCVPAMLFRLDMYRQEFNRGGRVFEYSYDQHSQCEYTAQDLRGVRNIIGRNYASFTAHRYWHSRDDTSPSFDFAAVSVDGEKIGTAMMSLGEVWTHYLLGDNNLAADTYEPRLVDEPESFLAPRAHRAVVDELIRNAVRHNNQLIVSTHSPQVLSRFPVSNLRMCMRTSTGIQVAAPTNFRQVRDAIGIEVAVRVVVLVEDVFAATVFTLVCEQTDPSLVRELDVVAAGGQSEVIAGLRVMASSSKIRFVGVLDGDARSSRIPDFAAGRLFFLPGQRSPEDELHGLAARAPSQLAHELGCSTWDVEAALDSTTDLDHQYWLGGLAEHLGRSPEVLTHVLVKLWIRETEASQFNEVVANIRRMVDIG
ncbi:AAA family ATPase [Nocardia sp. NPDC005998]|uniref:AAA family ATPase n=1 Tax=Nocardia sp. NPDC005998 TaxID=3156894 RepID=UPI0033A81E58